MLIALINGPVVRSLLQITPKESPYTYTDLQTCVFVETFVRTFLLSLSGL